MKNYSISPTEQNAVELLKSNSLGRNDAVFRFLKLIDSIDDSCSIALNGEWGSGKTIFIKQVKLLLDYNNPQSALSDELRQSIEPIARQIPECASRATVYYDAWANDDQDDPILSLVHATIASGQSDYSTKRRQNLLKIAGEIAGAVTKLPISDMIENAKAEDSLAPLKERDNIHNLIHKFLDELILEKANYLVIFIDELDRCRPAYAVQLLERIKHYFDDDRVTFVFSVDVTQLQHTVKSYYGYAFNATRYLDKFFDLRISLPEIDYKRFIETRFPFVTLGNIYDEICVRVVQYFSFSLREVERYMRLIRIAAYNYNIIPAFSEDRALQFARMYIVPILIGLSMVDMDEYKKFIRGENSAILCEILSSEADFIHQDWLQTRGEKMTENVEMDLGEKLKKVYDVLFADREDRYRAHSEKCVGDMKFTAQTRREIMNMVALLAPCAEYDFE